MLTLEIDGQQISFTAYPSGTEFETGWEAVHDLTINSCINVLRRHTSSNPDNPFVGLTVILDNLKLLPWERDSQAVYILAEEELICEFEVITAIETAYEKYREILGSIDLGQQFTIASILPVIGERLESPGKSARDWDIKIALRTEQARFSDLFRVREKISRVSFPPDLEANEDELLFRVYLPRGRLYANEADRLLSLFRDWLNHTGRHNIRQEGYRTTAGQVYEFFGKESLNPDELQREFATFSAFLMLCVEDSKAAIASLSQVGLDDKMAEVAVARYSKEIRRLQLDLHQERESRLLAIRHSLESELLDAAIDVEQWGRIYRFIDTLVPHAEGTAPMPLLALPGATSSAAPVLVNFNQQIISAVESTVIQSIQGTTNLGAQAKELLDVVSRFGGQEATTLESAVYELEDPDARSANRLNAKRRLKSFLGQLAGKVEDVTLTALAKYLESKLGI